METYKNIYKEIYSFDNLMLAYKKARKGKTLKDYVITFESNLENNLISLQKELITGTYLPKPLTTFIVRDSKTRRINASDFRDRILQHALCNIIQPILSKEFIYDSFANQKSKGTHKAIKRFEAFSKKVGINGYAFKADIKHYFDTVDHNILLAIISKKIKDKDVLSLISTILKNHNSKIEGKGMPIGNLTSQFWANVYLGKLDQYIKHELKIKYYIRYVDDFVILSKSKKELAIYKTQISQFLSQKLKIDIHPDKSRIIQLQSGITFLGFRIFNKYKLLKRSNAKRIWKRLRLFKKRNIPLQQAMTSLNGWFAYANFANTYNLQTRVISRFKEIYAIS